MKDVLSDIFDAIRIEATLYFRTDFTPPWAIRVPVYKAAARFHLVVQGCCRIELPDGESVDLGAGDMALIPRGREHVLCDSLGRQPAALENILAESGYTGDGVFVLGRGDPRASTQMICGHFGLADGADHPLLRALPQLIVLTAADRARQPFLDETVRLLVRRVFSDGVGAAAAVGKLSEAFFIEAIRAAALRSSDLDRIFSAMTDPRIGRALSLIHEDVARDWTVDSLASAVAMSRSRFANRFTEFMGVGPMRYLADWRLQRALRLLASPRANVQMIAAQVGYQSPAAFTRAFTQKFGAPPTEFRRAEA